MNVLFNALMMDIQEVARAKGIERFRVSHERNAQGELVVALIVEDKHGRLAKIDAPDEHRPRGRIAR